MQSEYPRNTPRNGRCIWPYSNALVFLWRLDRCRYPWRDLLGLGLGDGAQGADEGLSSQVRLPAMVPWMLWELIWAILFSPYGADTRIIAPYYVVLIITCMGIAARRTAGAAPVMAKKRLVTGVAKKRLKTA
jgi:hypothetical protein